MCSGQGKGSNPITKVINDFLAPITGSNSRKYAEEAKKGTKPITDAVTGGDQQSDTKPPDSPDAPDASLGRLLALRRLLGGSGIGIRANMLTGGSGVTGKATTRRRGLLGG